MDKVPFVTEDALAESPPPPYEECSTVGGPSNTYLPKQESSDSTGVPEMKVYKRRWFILLVFSFLACHQCAVWNTWGPIASSVQSAYGWSDGTVAMMANWGTIMFVLCSVPLSVMLEIMGLRPTCLLVSFFVMLGSVLRCCRTIISNPQIFLASCHLCAILNGISGVTIMASPPVISSLWFPQNERTTATSINQAANMLGNGLSMIVGPALVMLNVNSNKNGTDTYSYYSTVGIQSANISSNRAQEDIRADIDKYMLIDAGVAIAIFICFCVYFPSKPPLAPTPTSVTVRTDFRSGLKELVVNKDILFICFAYSLSQGIMGTWMSVMVFNLRDLGITDQEVGYIGLGSVVGQCVASMVFGFCSDILRRRMKVTIIVLLVISGAMFVVLTLMCLKVITSTYIYLTIVIIAATSLNFACCPLFFELAVEIAYPVSENLVACFLTATYNFVGILFLFIFFIPNIGDVWINYVLVGSVVFSIPAVLVVRERYNRSTVDDLVTGMTQ